MAAKSTKTPSFSEAFEELERIVQELEKTEKIDLEESLKSFERGLELAEECKKKLSEVENKVVEIKKKFGVSPNEADLL